MSDSPHLIIKSLKNKLKPLLLKKQAKLKENYLKLEELKNTHFQLNKECADASKITKLTREIKTLERKQRALFKDRIRVDSSFTSLFEKLGFFIIPFTSLLMLLDVPNGFEGEDYIRYMMLGEQKRLNFEKAKLEGVCNKKEKSLRITEFKAFMKLFEACSITILHQKFDKEFSRGFIKESTKIAEMRDRELGILRQDFQDEIEEKFKAKAGYR